MTALEFAQFAHEVKLPEGVLNVITGDGPTTGDALSRNHLVDKVAFTGSVPTGSKIMANCAKDIRNVSLELGGKSPVIVFDDVEVEKG